MYRVLQMIVSKEGNMAFNEPTDVQFYYGDDKAKAISAMASAIADTDSPYYSVMNVRVVFEDVA